MGVFALKADERVAGVSFTADSLSVALKDGLQATIAYFALRTATPEFSLIPQRSKPRPGRGRLTLAG